MEAQKQIKVNGQTINYTLKTSKKANRLRLTISLKEGLIATKPERMSQNIVEGFILKKANWVIRKLDQLNGDKIKTNFFQGASKSYKVNKQMAEKFIQERVLALNKNYGFTFQRVCVKNQKTRWGSCSKKGNLNFNYKILFLPQELSDYIVVHELCHLKELNHSKKFWKLVAQSTPDYLKRRKILKGLSQKS
ncbi:hypothetical protein COX24_01950 [bacterium (Candidatus Gribaldobacteria) CG23_combo_of_CG06-09_8_20_14_all_37_87_8]|uniref:YgjP-like metallopeptidase domain-containing protein n=2 Tax=Candidatus Gribaldobacteria TaxID=2798536 RepID=A0A2G9ZEY9_9BACT|nr:MAG: hypothetical protein COX24_01950 [bacterium (Candidatus Gribaldobacteria) CG23_combo_of_CG06-09_8_20_14_all_37_87_8]PIR90793.1 MAG: hypothetical protein COU05_00180 [bacterium (Candidatus Gribaldobacteria) CG10_big_fil_rev_8_21_14_0_10_37_21]